MTGLMQTILYECHTVALSRPVYLGVLGGPDLLDAARARLADLERAWGAGGEIDKLNRHPGVMLPVSADTVLLAVLATEPVGPRRPAGTGPAHPEPGLPPGLPSGPRSGLGPGLGLGLRSGLPSGLRFGLPSGLRCGLLVDVRHGTVGRLADEPVDLDDLAAALAVDLVLTDLVDAGVAGVCVAIGPNARAAGAAPRGGWLVSSCDVSSCDVGCSDIGSDIPRNATGCSGVGPRAIATARRRLAAPDALSEVTVIADQAWRAHLLATAALALPADRARALLRDAATAAVLTGPAAGPDAGPDAVVRVGGRDHEHSERRSTTRSHSPAA